MADTYPQTSFVEHSDPAIGAVAIDYSSADQLIVGSNRWLHISTAGTLKVDMARGDTVSLVLAVGVYKYRITKIYQSGSSSAAGFVMY